MLATRRAEAITLRLTNRMTGSPVLRRVEDRANLSFFQLGSEPLLFLCGRHAREPRTLVNDNKSTAAKKINSRILRRLQRRNFREQREVFRRCYLVWHSGRTSVSGWRTFPVLRSTCS